MITHEDKMEIQKEMWFSLKEQRVTPAEIDFTDRWLGIVLQRIQDRAKQLHATNARPGQGQAPSPKPCANCDYAYHGKMSGASVCRECIHGNQVDHYRPRMASAIA